MKKTLIVKELTSAVVLRVQVENSRGKNTKEVARFSKSGIRWVCLGAAGRALINGIGWVDEIKFDGSQHTYDMLVTLEVIEPKRVVAA